MIPTGTAATGPQSAAYSGGNSASSERNPQDGLLDSRFGRFFSGLTLVLGFLARLLPAKRLFLNPDEALHYLLSSQTSVVLAYRAALTNAHPPLLILVLYYWRRLGHSEWLLRFPSVVAGTACCWFFYLWLKQVTDRSTAFVGLLLIAFSPTLIGLSAEIRQYALLLLFVACCLYLSELALRKNSILWMFFFSLSLYGALLSHYSSLLFAFTAGVYMLARLWPPRQKWGLFATWLAGQLGALALVVFFLVTHVAVLRKNGMPREIADTWLRKSIFHYGETNLAVFLFVQTLRVFTYLFSHGVVGALALLAFLAGMVWLARNERSSNQEGPTSRELALLLGVPFVINAGVAIAGLYPYGGTRHNAFLGVFAIAGASVGLAAWRTSLSKTKHLVIIGTLAICNVFPSPPPAIRARNQTRSLMDQATDYLRTSVPAGSLVLADYQSGLLFGYYVCGQGVVQVFPPRQLTEKVACGAYSVITTRPQEWEFGGDNFPDQLRGVIGKYGFAPGTKIWLFDAGWIGASAPGLYPVLRSYGCSAPRKFGENIFVCELTVGGDTGVSANIDELPSSGRQ
jgi:hypothetical protein